MISTKKTENNKNIGAKLSKKEYDEVSYLVNEGFFKSDSDFLKEAVKDKLKSTKYIKIRDLDYKTAKNEVLEYYKIHKEAYISELAENLKLDIVLIAEIVQDLINEKKLGN